MIEPAVRQDGTAVRSKVGRPRTPEERKRIYLSARVDPITHDWLTARRAKGDSLGKVLDDLVARAMARDDPAAY